MCRLAAYVGDNPITLAQLIYDPPHSLEHAAYAPKEMLRGSVNVDGTGVVWWDEDPGEPLRYVTTQPPWSDPNLPHLAGRLRGTTVLAAVRSATPGMPFGPSNVAPFVEGRVAGIHNGWIGGFNAGLGRKLTDLLSDERFGRLEALNDSLVLFSLVSQMLEDDPDLSLADAVAETVRRVSKEVVAAGETATLNLVVASAGELVAVRTSADYAVNSLYVRLTSDAAWLLSERLDDSEGWRLIPEYTLAVVSAGDVAIHPLDHDGAGR